MKWHQAETATGKLVHAVAVKNKIYRRRTACGVFVLTKKQRIFSPEVENACSRCSSKVENS